MMKFVSFNINGIRAHLHQLNTVIHQLNPDVIGLQETKVADNQFPVETILNYGYHVYSNGQKKDYGVALFFRKPPLFLIRDLPNDNFLLQKRIIIAKIITSIGIISIINGYFPQGENSNSNKFILKKQFYQNLQNYIQQTYNKQSLLILMGDMNISPTDLDIGISEKDQKKWIKSGRCSFLPEEIIWMNNLMNWGLIDMYRESHSYDNTRYSWFNYRSNGFNKKQGLRIDFILVTKPLISYYKDSNINYEIRSMDRPSDHAPIWMDFNF